MNRIKRAFLVVFIIIAVFGGIKGYEMLAPPFEDSSLPNSPRFEMQKIDFRHELGDTYPFAGASVIDSNNDGRFEVFLAGSKGQDDALIQFSTIRIDETSTVSSKNIIENTGLSSKSATFGSTALDMDSDGDTDLIVARESGVHMYLNNQGSFTLQYLDVFLEDNTIPVDVAVGDINNDNLPDLYISTFVSMDRFKSLTFNDPEHRSQNKLLLNRGNFTFEDISHRVPLEKNSFTAAFVDLNNDGFQDLVVSPNTEKIAIYENLMNETFEQIHNLSGYGTWMGLAIGDVDNDDDSDLLFSNMGNFAPDVLLRGDLFDSQELHTDWILLENNLNQTGISFSDITKEHNLDRKEFSWGAVFSDLNLDGRQDLVVATNYVKWFVHKVYKTPGRLFTQSPEGLLTSTTRESGLTNKEFGFAPLVLDVNLDGHPDVLYLNIDSKAKLYVNKNSDAHGIKVIIPDTLSAMGAKATITYNNVTQTQVFNSKQGVMSDQAPELFFGLGEYSGPVSLTVTLRDGTRVASQEVDSDSTVRFATTN